MTLSTISTDELKNYIGAKEAANLLKEVDGNPQNIYGGGEWFVIGEERIWHVRNNGTDGGDWSLNNVRTGGAGAIGYSVPFDNNLAHRLVNALDAAGEQVPQAVRDLVAPTQAEPQIAQPSARNVAKEQPGVKKADAKEGAAQAKKQASQGEEKYSKAKPEGHRANVLAEIGKAIGQLRAQRLIRNGRVVVLKSQEEAKQVIDAGPNPKFSKEFEKKSLLDLGVKDSESLHVGDTPIVLTTLGAQQLPLVVSGRVLNKATVGKYGGTLGIEELRQVHAEIYDPVAVFESATQPNSMVILTQVKDAKGDLVIVPVHLSTTRDHHQVNAIKSIYGKENSEKWIKRQVKNGNLLYMNTEKAKAFDKAVWLHLPTPTLASEAPAVKKALGYARKILTEADIVNAEIKHSKDGKIQGFYLDGKAYLVEDGIAEGQAMAVLMHELGEHAAQLGFANSLEYRAILKSLEKRQNEQSETGEAIRAALQRVPAETAGKHKWSEVAAYLVENNADQGLSIVNRLVAFFKKWLFKAGGISADKLTHKDLAAFAYSAVRAEARRSGKVDNKANNIDNQTDNIDNKPGFLASMAESLGVTPEQLQREYDAVVKRYQGTVRWLKAPNGKKSNLNERQWVQVRTESFKKWFGDWEAAGVRSFVEGEPVSTLTGKEFTKDDSGLSLVDRVAHWYDDNGFATVHAGALGVDVQLDRRAVKDSIAHGLGRDKAAAFASVPEALKQGMVGHQEPVHGGPAGSMVFHVVAPIRIKGQDMVIDVLVRSDANANRMYVHEVALKEKLHSLAFKTGADAVAEQPSGASVNGAIRNVLQRVFSVNPDNVSKVVDANGEPMTTYHGSTPANALGGKNDFSVFKKFSHFGTQNAANDRIGQTAEQGISVEGANVYPVFLNVKRPVQVVDDGNSGHIEDVVEQVRKAGAITNNEAKGIQHEARLQSVLEGKGYDGFVYKNTIEGPGSLSYVAFEPSQIKSATGNTGAFDASNQDIRYSVAKDKATDEKHTAGYADDFGSIADDLGKKHDIWALTSMVKTAEYTLSKVGAGMRMLDAAARRMENRFRFENEILDNLAADADPAEYQEKHNSFINTFRDLKKDSKDSYQKVQGYLLEADRTGEGFRLKHEYGYAVYDPDGNFLGIAKTKEKAHTLVQGVVVTI